MEYTASKLRESIYTILDTIIATGQPITINRNGKKLKIIFSEPVSKLKKLKKRKLYKGDSEDFVSFDWSNELNLKL